jgi:undecaprenyl-phosphate 4-deoxy-4-formamido-L-arabinose transferase
MNLSIIIPVYNSAKIIGKLVEALENELSSLYELEVILVNDGSPDEASAQVCENIAQNNTKVKFLDLSRNFGEHSAVMAGLHYCKGEVAVIIDDDFQNPPSEIIKLVDKIHEGYDVIYTYYKNKKHSFFRNLGSQFNNLVASILLDKPFNLYLSSFKALNRFVIDEVIKYTGPHPYIDGLILRITRHYGRVLVEHRLSEKDKSGYTFRKLISLWMNMFTNFSILPLRIATFVGFLFSFLGLLGAVIFFIEKLQNPNLPVGWASLIISLLVISGIQLFALGMVGEYLGRLFLKDSGQPQYVLRKSVNCESDSHEDKN